MLQTDLKPDEARSEDSSVRRSNLRTSPRATIGVLDNGSPLGQTLGPLDNQLDGPLDEAHNPKKEDLPLSWNGRG